jgi:hypothetical protein
MRSSAAVTFVLTAVVACSTSPNGASSTSQSAGGAGGAACVPLPASGSQPATFTSDIAPLWDRKCTGFLCHASPYDAADAEAFLSSWVEQSSAVAAQARIIVAGDPAASFLLHKLDATHDCGDFVCASGACGQPMPTGEPLSDDERAMFRGWIAAGAAAD